MKRITAGVAAAVLGMGLLGTIWTVPAGHQPTRANHVVAGRTWGAPPQHARKF